MAQYKIVFDKLDDELKEFKDMKLAEVYASNKSDNFSITYIGE